MVWGCIWKGGRSDLVVMQRDEGTRRRGYTAQSYQKALEEGLLPCYDETRHFQQDNATIHVAASTEQWLQERKISWIDWPAHSPDLNPIEHVWSLLKRKLAQMYPDLWNLKQNRLDIEGFTRCLRAAWWDIDQRQIDGLISGMPRRLAAIKKVKGWYTKY